MTTPKLVKPKAEPITPAMRPRPLDQILREMIGFQCFQIAQLQAAVEQLQAENAALKTGSSTEPHLVEDTSPHGRDSRDA